MTIETKAEFAAALREFAAGLAGKLCTADGQWAIKGFVDVDQQLYTMSGDTKLTSKILEIQIFPFAMDFADQRGFNIILTDHQNHYPDLSVVHKGNPEIKFAVDLKTTYRKADKPHLCNGFTLGSHGEYFRNRTSSKNIRFPYAHYQGHFCLGVIYDRVAGSTIDETKRVDLEELTDIASVMRNMHFFVAEKWMLASDRRGSHNTANIGSINYIDDILAGRGMFSALGEEWFDEYWINYGLVKSADGKSITRLDDFVRFKNGDASLIVPRRTKES